MKENTEEMSKAKSIFDGAEFSDKFVTRNGTTVVYIARHEERSIHNDSVVSVEHTYAMPGRCTVMWCRDDGTNTSGFDAFDIVSKCEKTQTAKSDSEIVEKAWKFIQDELLEYTGLDYSAVEEAYRNYMEEQS